MGLQGLGSGGALKLSAGILGRWSPPRKLLGSKEHLDWLKIHLNVVKITTVQDYKHLKEQCEWNNIYTVSKLRVKQEKYESRI